MGSSRLPEPLGRAQQGRGTVRCFASPGIIQEDSRSWEKGSPRFLCCCTGGSAASGPHLPQLQRPIFGQHCLGCCWACPRGLGQVGKAQQRARCQALGLPHPHCAPFPLLFLAGHRPWHAASAPVWVLLIPTERYETAEKAEREFFSGITEMIRKARGCVPLVLAYKRAVPAQQSPLLAVAVGVPIPGSR